MGLRVWIKELGKEGICLKVESIASCNLRPEICIRALCKEDLKQKISRNYFNEIPGDICSWGYLGVYMRPRVRNENIVLTTG